MSSNTVQSKPFQDYWFNSFEDGESLDDLTVRLNSLFVENADKDLNEYDSNTHSWIERTITDAIAAKQDYYAKTITGKISSFFQGVAQTFFGCAGYETSLERANAFLQLVQNAPSIEHLNPAVVEDSPVKLTSTSFLDACLFFELHKEEMLGLARSENRGIGLHVPGEQNTSFYVMPNGNCYLVAKTPKNIAGIGAAKVVYKAYDLINKKLVACNTSRMMPRMEDDNNSEAIEMEKVNFSLVSEEYKTLSKFKGMPGIIQVRDRFVHKDSATNSDCAAFFTDFYENGNLHELLKRNSLTPNQKIHLMAKLLEKAQTLHQHGYLHRDFKETNVLIKKVEIDDQVFYEPILIDFDRCCKKDDQPSLKKTASTPDYWPPEYAQVCRNESPQEEDVARVTTEKMDVWALGIMLYRIYYDQRPDWMDMPGESKLNAIVALAEDWLKLEESGPIAQVIQRMLQVDPANRTSLTDAIFQLEQIGMD